MIDFKQYQEDAERTMAPVSDTLRPGMAQEIHMVMGMETEVGELMDAYKKELAYSKPLDDVNLREEVGDLMWYVVNLCRLKGWDLEQILNTNIEKLKARYPDKFTTKDALNRNLDNEREILEDG